jgi:ABC-type glycerol-3-phosphate transport system permease component
MAFVRAKRISRGLGGNLALLFILLALGAFMIIPMLFTINNAFKPVEELFLFPPRIFAQNPTVNNFLNLSAVVGELKMPLTRYFFNTALLTSVNTAGQVILASLCAYSLAKVKFPGHKFIFKLIVLSLMFPPSVVNVPRYIVLSQFNLIDSYTAMILPGLGATMGLYLMKQFLENTVPDSLLEAARIDGAPEIHVFFRIVMPLLKPAWLTLVVLCIQNYWSAPSPHTYSEIYKTFPQALSQLNAGGLSRTGVAAAVSLLMMTVPIAAFIITQSKMLETMGSSGMKE